MRVLTLILLTLWAVVAEAQFLPQLGNKNNTTKVVRESELYNLDKQLGVNGSYIFIYDKEQCDTIDGQYHGAFRAYDSLDSTIVMEGRYDHGTRIGNWRWYNHGQKLVEGNYQDGKMVGEWLFYNKNSKKETLQTRCFLNNGKLDSVVCKYALKNSSLIQGFYLKEYYTDGHLVTFSPVELYNEDNICCLRAEFPNDTTIKYSETTTELMVDGQLCETFQTIEYYRPKQSTFSDLEALVASMGTKDPKEMRAIRMGDYYRADSIGQEKLVTTGTYDTNEKSGTWLTLNVSQGYRLVRQYDGGILMMQKYERLKNGKPFSGKITVISAEATTLMSIKKGVANGKTLVTDANGQVTTMLYKDGKPVEKKK